MPKNTRLLRQLADSSRQVRLRFAPSPTGYLHVGGLRTALFNYLITKSLGGRLLLRIEDTDQKRQVEGAVEKLIEILDWIGIEFDEGPGAIRGKKENIGKFGPYVQSQRLEIYKKHAQELLEKDEAYYCFCSSERLEKMRAGQQAKKQPPRYDRKCRDLSKKEVEKKLKLDKKYVIRQKMPLDGEVVAKDELRGDIKFKAQELEDQVLIKSDNMPTYQLANVVDDHLMKISHVLRGEEWIPSFPKNILLYKSFGWTPPKFIHMPLTLSKDGGKLSKRHGDVAVEDYKNKGYLPEALINFSALLGWSPYASAPGDKHPKGSKELFTLEGLEKVFDYKDMGTSGAVFDVEKLDYFNGYYIRQMDLDKLVKLCKPYLKENLKKTTDSKRQTTEYISKVVRLEQERMKKLSEIGELTGFFFTDKLKYPADLLIWKKLTKKEIKENLVQVYEQLLKIPEKNWTDNSIEDALISYIKAKKEKIGNFLWPMRVALTGQKASPGPFEVAEVLGKVESLKRIKQGMDKL